MTPESQETLNSTLKIIEEYKITEHQKERSVWMARWILGLVANKPNIDVDITAREAAKVCTYISFYYPNVTVPQDILDRLNRIEYETRDLSTI